MLWRDSDQSGGERERLAFDRSDDLPLSAPQLGIWIDQDIDPAATNYNVGEYLEILGPVDTTRFETALRQVVSEVAALNVRFLARADGPRQIREAVTDWPMPVVDLGAASDPRAAAESWMNADMARRVDPLRDPLFAFALFKAAPDRFFWYARYHHLVMDGFGVALIARRLAEVYTALANGATVGESPFAPLAALLSEDDAYRNSGHFARDQEYWSQRLAGCPEPTTLSKRAWTRSSRFLRHTAYLPASTVGALRELAKNIGVTLPQLVTAAMAVYLHGLTGEQDLVLGFSVSGRIGALASQSPSMIMNVVPLRLSVRTDMALADIAGQVGRGLREAFRRQRYRIADMRRDLRRIERPIHGVLVNIMAFDYAVRFAGHAVLAHNISNGPVEDFSVTVYDRSDDDELRLDFDANPERYGIEDVVGHQHRFLNLLNALVAPDTESALGIGRLPLLTDAERRQLLVEWNGTAAAYPRDKCLHELVAEQVLCAPDAVAVVCEDQQLTFAELDRRANQLAHHLRLFGVGPDVVAGLCLERSLEMVVGLLGILKAGGAYLPLDPGYPPERLAYMLSNARSPVLLTQARLVDRLPAHGARVVRLDADWPQIAGQPETTPETGVGPANLAYVIYTSGSTGRPKGVMNEHGAVVNRLCWMQAEYGLSPLDRVLQKTPFTFDVSVWEFLWPLMQGARLVMARPDGHKDPAYLVDLICRQGITTLHFVPSMLEVFLQSPSIERCVSLKRVICSGEALSGALQTQFFRRLDVELHNLYGPTEAAIDVTFWPCRRDDASAAVPIGRPIWNTQMFVLNETLSPVPIGVAGELYIGGVGVARGYVGRPDLTAERFIPSPFGEPGQRLYRTGDLARWRADRTLEYLGRIDDQVKIRGFRIELGEIEAVLKRHPAVRDAAVVMREDAPGNKRLVAYMTTAGAPLPAAGDLRTLLGQHLPDYMVPSAFVAMDALPLSHNGKLDRKALPAPEQGASRSDRPHVAPRTPIENVLAGIWGRMLGVQKIGIHDNFFELGGHSLLAVRTVHEINRTLNVSVGMAALFRHPTIERFAASALGLDSAAAGRPAVVLMRDGDGGPPLYFMYACSYEFRMAQFLGGKHPVFGIDVPLRPAWSRAARENRRADLPTLDQLVEPYVEALRAHAGSSACILAGYCFAGLLAFETARRYQEQGGKVEKVILFDSFPTIPSAPRAAWRQWRRHCRDAAAHLASDRTSEAIACFVRGSQRTAGWLLRQVARRCWSNVRYSLWRPAPAGMTGVRDADGAFLDMAALWRLYDNIYQTHKPKRLDAGGILARAQAADVREAPYREFDHSLGWGNLFAEGLEIISVTGDHLSMMDLDEHSAPLAAKVRAALERHATKSSGTRSDIDVERPLRAS